MTYTMLPTESIAAHTGESVTELFKEAFRGYPAGVAVITAEADSGPVAMTATSVSSVNVAPNLLMMSISDRSSSAPTITSAKTLVVHLLTARDAHLAKLAATSGADRFADTSLWERLESGEPCYRSSGTTIRGRVRESLKTSGATVLIVEAVEILSIAHASSAPLVYHRREWHTLSEISRLE